MKNILLISFLFTCSVSLFSQGINSISPVDTVFVEEIDSDSTFIETVNARIDDPISMLTPPEIMGLDYGFKGFIWGSPKGTIPQVSYMDSSEFSSDSSFITLFGSLGPDTVSMDYIFGESGLWKVEISYVIDPQDIDSQITDFHRIENIISEIYGSPVSTQQIESGPGLSFNNLSTVNFSRAFFMSSWVEMPSRIELILHSLVQKNMNDFSIIKDKTSLLRLVYYNPDFMVESEEVKVEVIPSIFDLY